MPEGDTIFRAARALQRALAGRLVTHFESVFPRLTRENDDAPLRGRTIESVEARGKHLLIRFSGDLVLRTHMRMHGTWHIYRPGERWRRPHHEMRVKIETADLHAVAFNVPVAEFGTGSQMRRAPALRDLGPDLLAADFSPGDAVDRIAERRDVEIADALLDQTAIAGIGNVYKSETLFVARVHPFARVGDLNRDALVRIVTVAGRLMMANVAETAAGGIVTYRGLRRTTNRLNPGARYWVYGRAGKPCRRCGTPVSRAKQGPHVRSTYWCEHCQSPGTRPQASGLAQGPSSNSQRATIGDADVCGAGPQKNRIDRGRTR